MFNQWIELSGGGRAISIFAYGPDVGRGDGGHTIEGVDRQPWTCTTDNNPRFAIPMLDQGLNAVGTGN